MKKKIIVFILCICIISTFCLQPAYAMGAESIIVGGGAAAGLSLTMPQVAILIAAGFGLVYGIQHADDIANGLNNALENAATNISNGLEELTYWKEQATKGAIALASAPAWIKTSVNEWISGLYETKEVETICCLEYPANALIPSNSFWGSQTVTFPVPTTILRAGSITPSGNFYNVSYSMLAVSTSQWDGSSKVYVNGNTYYAYLISAGTSLPSDKPLAGNNKLVYDSVLTLPNLSYIKANYSGNTDAEKYIRAWLDGYFVTSGGICPDTIVGGIDDAIGTHGIDSIKMPDLDIGGSKLLTPDVLGGSIDDVLDNTLTGLKNKEISWEKYMDDVAVGNPSVSIPVEGEGVKDFPITDTGVSDIPIDTPIPDNPSIPGNPSVEVPEGLEPFTISLINLFPFCIPVDIAEFVNVLCAEPEAPCFEWGFPTLDGTIHKMQIDLSPFDSVAQLLRNMELLLFCIGLAMITRNQIRG